MDLHIIALFRNLLILLSFFSATDSFADTYEVDYFDVISGLSDSSISVDEGSYHDFVITNPPVLGNGTSGNKIEWRFDGNYLVESYNTTTQRFGFFVGTHEVQVTFYDINYRKYEEYIWTVSISKSDLIPTIDLKTTGVLKPGDTVEVDVTVLNDGDASAPGSEFELYFSTSRSSLRDEIKIDTYSLSSISAGNQRSRDGIQFDVPSTISADTWYIYVVADPDGDIDESNESNNTAASGGLSIAEFMPDLIPTIDLKTTGVLKPGDTVEVDVTVLNDGDASAPGSEFELYFSTSRSSLRDEIKIDTYSLSSISAGNQRSRDGIQFDVPSTISADTWYIYVVADPDGDIDESNESNNTAASGGLSIAELMPDLIPTIDLKTTGVLKPGDTVEVDVTVLNDGDASAPGSEFELYFSTSRSSLRDEIKIDTYSLSSISAGNQRSRDGIQFDVPSTISADTWYIYVVADPDGNIDESNESNNTAASGGLIIENTPPGRVNYLSPSNYDVQTPVDVKLEWTAVSDSETDEVTHMLYFGLNPDAMEFVGYFPNNQDETKYEPSDLTYSTTYYWRVITSDGTDETNSEVFWFTTEPSPEHHAIIEEVLVYSKPISEFNNTENIKFVASVRNTGLLTDYQVSIQILEKETGDSIDILQSNIETLATNERFQFELDWYPPYSGSFDIRTNLTPVNVDTAPVDTETLSTSVVEFIEGLHNEAPYLLKAELEKPQHHQLDNAILTLELYDPQNDDLTAIICVNVEEVCTENTAQIIENVVFPDDYLLNLPLKLGTGHNQISIVISDGIHRTKLVHSSFVTEIDVDAPNKFVQVTRLNDGYVDYLYNRLDEEYADLSVSKMLESIGEEGTVNKEVLINAYYKGLLSIAVEQQSYMSSAEDYFYLPYEFLDLGQVIGSYGVATFQETANGNFSLALFGNCENAEDVNRCQKASDVYAVLPPTLVARMAEGAFIFAKGRTLYFIEGDPQGLQMADEGLAKLSENALYLGLEVGAAKGVSLAYNMGAKAVSKVKIVLTKNSDESTVLVDSKNVALVTRTSDLMDETLKLKTLGGRQLSDEQIMEIKQAASNFHPDTDISDLDKTLIDATAIMEKNADILKHLYLGECRGIHFDICHLGLNDVSKLFERFTKSAGNLRILEWKLDGQNKLIDTKTLNADFLSLNSKTKSFLQINHFDFETYIKDSVTAKAIKEVYTKVAEQNGVENIHQPPRIPINIDYIESEFMTQFDLIKKRDFGVHEGSLNSVKQLFVENLRAFSNQHSNVLSVFKSKIFDPVLNTVSEFQPIQLFHTGGYKSVRLSSGDTYANGAEIKVKRIGKEIIDICLEPKKSQMIYCPELEWGEKKYGEIDLLVQHKKNTDIIVVGETKSSKTSSSNTDANSQIKKIQEIEPLLLQKLDVADPSSAKVTYVKVFSELYDSANKIANPHFELNSQGHSFGRAEDIDPTGIPTISLLVPENRINNYLGFTFQELEDLFASIELNSFTLFDFNHDYVADIALRRPSTGMQYILNSESEGSIQRIKFGSQINDIPVTGDFDGDGIYDVGVRRLSNKTWYILNSSGEDLYTNNDDGITRLNFGKHDEDIPVPADYDGDGIADIAFRRPSNQTWYIYNSSGVDELTNNEDGISRVYFGKRAEDIPVPADYDGDGRADIAVRRPSTQLWYINNSSGSDPFNEHEDGISRKRFGTRTEDIPVPADYDGDGRADIAVRRPSTQFWYVLNSSGTNFNSSREDGIQRFNFGRTVEDIPIPADYDGDGITDIAVRRPSTFMQYILRSSDNEIQRIRFGTREEDIPLAAPVSIRMQMAGEAKAVSETSQEFDAPSIYFMSEDLWLVENVYDKQASQTETGH